MKKLFYVVGVVFILGVMGCRDKPNDSGNGNGEPNDSLNVVFNPGFDMTPWDTGWTIDTASSYSANANAWASLGPDVGVSLPNCCSLKIWTGAWSGGEAWAQGEIYQFFPEVKNVIFKAHVRYSLMAHWPGGWCGVQLYINSQWDTVWKRAISYGTVDSNWTEISVSINDTVGGIKFYARSHTYASSAPEGGHAWFWIDNIYVGEAAVEENDIRVKNLELSISPNPFTHYTFINLPSNQTKLEIYDMMGRLVDEPSGKTIGQNLQAGIYFVRLKEREKPIKIIKIGRLR